MTENSSRHLENNIQLSPEVEVTSDGYLPSHKAMNKCGEFQF